MKIKDLKNQLELPVIAAPMFIVSGPEMVIEACKNGIVGSIPALNGRSSEDFEAMLQTITSELAAFGRKPDKNLLLLP